MQGQLNAIYYMLHCIAMKVCTKTEYELIATEADKYLRGEIPEQEEKPKRTRKKSE